MTACRMFIAAGIGHMKVSSCMFPPSSAMVLRFPLPSDGTELPSNSQRGYSDIEHHLDAAVCFRVKDVIRVGHSVAVMQADVVRDDGCGVASRYALSLPQNRQQLLHVGTCRTPPAAICDVLVIALPSPARATHLTARVTHLAARVTHLAAYFPRTKISSTLHRTSHQTWFTMTTWCLRPHLSPRLTKIISLLYFKITNFNNAVCPAGIPIMAGKDIPCNRAATGRGMLCCTTSPPTPADGQAASGT